MIRSEWEAGLPIVPGTGFFAEQPDYCATLDDTRWQWSLPRLTVEAWIDGTEEDRAEIDRELAAARRAEARQQERDQVALFDWWR